jgi:hypothetical protein
VRDAERHASNRERVSTLRRLRRQGLNELDPDERQPDRIIDYTVADQRPRLAPLSPARQNPRHDTATRIRMDHQAQDVGDSEMTDWETLQAARARYGHTTVAFPAPPGSPERGFRGRDEAPQITDWAAAGELYRPSGRAGQAALAQQAQDRFGGRVSMPPPVHSSQISSSMSAMEQREQVQVQRDRQASDHMRNMAASWRR